MIGVAWEHRDVGGVFFFLLEETHHQWHGEVEEGVLVLSQRPPGNYLHKLHARLQIRNNDILLDVCIDVRLLDASMG